jgi:RNase P/RNase MRP subunit POP5
LIDLIVSFVQEVNWFHHHLSSLRYSHSLIHWCWRRNEANVSPVRYRTCTRWTGLTRTFYVNLKKRHLRLLLHSLLISLNEKSNQRTSQKSINSSYNENFGDVVSKQLMKKKKARQDSVIRFDRCRLYRVILKLCASARKYGVDAMEWKKYSPWKVQSSAFLIKLVICSEYHPFLDNLEKPLFIFSKIVL